MKGKQFSMDNIKAITTYLMDIEFAILSRQLDPMTTNAMVCSSARFSCDKCALKNTPTFTAWRCWSTELDMLQNSLCQYINTPEITCDIDDADMELVVSHYRTLLGSLKHNTGIDFGNILELDAEVT